MVNRSAKNPEIQTEAELLQPVNRGIWGRVFYHLGTFVVRLGLKFELKGTENLPVHAPYIIAPNHETYVDGMLAAMGVPRHQRDLFCSLAAKELLVSHGLFGKLMMRVGRGIPIDREGSSIHSLKICINQLDQGNILMVHPEGTRTADGKLGRIRDGCAFIAKHADVPIVPCFIDGGYEIFSRHMKWPRFWSKPFRRRRLIVSYGEPMHPRDYKNTKALTQALTEWMETMYKNKQVPREYRGPNLTYMEREAEKAEDA